MTMKTNEAEPLFEIFKALFEVVYYLADQQGEESRLAVEQHLDALESKLERFRDEQD